MKRFFFFFLFIFPIFFSHGVTIRNLIPFDREYWRVHSQPEDLVPTLTKVLDEPPITIDSTTKHDAMGLAARENTHFFSRVFNSGDNFTFLGHYSRFREIKANPEVAREEIDFWGRQVSEHALFAHLGLEDPKMKQRALKIHQAIEHFRSKFNKNPNDLALMNTLLPLLKELRDLQIGALKRQEKGDWVGWFFPSYFSHVTLELDYFVDKLNGITYTPEEEVAFYNRINGEHAVFTSHFLDPVEQKLITQANDLSHEFMDIPKNEKEMMIKLSLIGAKHLDEFNKTAKAKSHEIKSVIHPVLLDHIIREGERSIATLENLGLHKEAQALSKTTAKELENYKA